MLLRMYHAILKFVNNFHPFRKHILGLWFFCSTSDQKCITSKGKNVQSRNNIITNKEEMIK